MDLGLTQLPQDGLVLVTSVKIFFANKVTVTVTGLG